MKVGKQSVTIDNVYIGSSAVTVGPKEHLGPLGSYYDKGYDNLYCNNKTWEKAEMQLLTDSINMCLDKEKLNIEDIDYFVGGDLNNQIIIGNYVLRNYDIPYFGIFGACSTSVEGLVFGASLIESKMGKKVLVGSSSHNATSERQFRYPTEYGGQKPDTLTFTVTAGGVCLLTNQKTNLKITRATVGKVIDADLKDPQDMGRAMAPAAFSTIYSHFQDFQIGPEEYDLIVTGDLSYYGNDMLIKLFDEVKIDMRKNYNDCGLMIYDRKSQEVFAGGSGCGCCAAVSYGYIFSRLRDKALKKVLIVATGALLNPIILAQKESIPGIAHAIVVERIDL